MKTNAFPTLAAAAGVAALVASLPAQAGLVGSTYTASISGATVTRGFASGPYTDPANPGFCIGPNQDNCARDGFGGFFTFADVSPTQATITFTFYGGTGVGPAAFDISLGNFLTLDASTVTDIRYQANSGMLPIGSFGLTAWNGRTASFTGTPDGGFLMGSSSRPFVFNVTLAPATPESESIPEPASLALAGIALAGLGLSRRSSRRRLRGATAQVRQAASG